MALTGHKVVCWDENGKPSFAEIGNGRIVVRVYKEYVLVEEKHGNNLKHTATIYDGYMYNSEHGLRVIVKGTPFRIFFIIILNEKMRLGIAKFGDVEEINERDFIEFAVWIAEIVSEAYEPGYDPCIPTDDIALAINKIREVRMYDQGDKYLADNIDGLETPDVLKPAVLPKQLTILDRLLGTYNREKDKLIKLANEVAGVFKKFLDGDKISQDEYELVREFVREVVVNLI